MIKNVLLILGFFLFCVVCGTALVIIIAWTDRAVERRRRWADAKAQRWLAEMDAEWERTHPGWRSEKHMRLP